MSVIRKALLTAAALGSVFVIAQPSYAQPQAVGSLTGWNKVSYQGVSKTWSGEVGQCHYVGDDWNDKIRSAKSGSATTTVVIYENHDCTGYALSVDGSGYYNIGTWVSGYKVVST